MDQLVNKKSMKMKVKIEVDSVEKWYRLLNNDFYIKNQHYNVQPWIFKPKQCCYCSSFDHMEEFCNKIERCLHCSKEDHKSEYCQATKSKFKCLTCEKKHASYSTKYQSVIKEVLKANSYYIQLYPTIKEKKNFE